jgi:hypothetical protein
MDTEGKDGKDEMLNPFGLMAIYISNERRKEGDLFFYRHSNFQSRSPICMFLPFYSLFFSSSF